jgi:hypothetical protein
VCAAFSVCRESDKNGTNGLCVLRDSAVCHRFAQHFLVDSIVFTSLIELVSLGCLRCCLLQCALGVRSIFCCCEFDRNAADGMLVFRYSAVCATFSSCCESDRNISNALSVPLYSAVCSRCAQHCPVVATLTKVEPLGVRASAYCRVRQVRAALCGCCESD